MNICCAFSCVSPENFVLFKPYAIIDQKTFDAEIHHVIK